MDGARSHPFALAGGLYRGLVRDALAFFYLQRSGIAIDEARAPGYGRPAGHPGDRSVAAWTGPDAERLYPGWSCPGRFDVSGGWYDAGDHGKYVTSGAMPVWQLLATVELIRRRGQRARWWAETEALLLEECRWQLDWLLRMQVPPGRPHAGMAFHRVHGTEWAPLPCWPHEDPTERVLHRPSTAATLHLAAAAAHGARVFRAEPAYAGRLLDAAVTAHRAAPPSRCCWRRTTAARSAAARTPTTTSRTSAPGRRPSSGLPRATRPTRRTPAARSRSTSTASTGTAWPPRRRSTSRCTATGTTAWSRPPTA